jgi:hypothetical protein
LLPMSARRLEIDMLQFAGRVIREYFGANFSKAQLSQSCAEHAQVEIRDAKDGSTQEEEHKIARIAVSGKASAPLRAILPAYDTNAVTDEYRKLYYPDDFPNLEPIVHFLREDAERQSPAISADERLCVEIIRYTTASMALGAPERLECASRTLANALASCGG